MGLFVPVQKNGKTEHVQGVMLINPATGEGTTNVTATIDNGTKIDAASALPAGGAGLIGWLSRIWSALSAQLPASLGIKTAAASLSVAPASDGIFTVEPLGIPAVARQVSVTTSNADTALTATCKRISIKARTCDVRYAVGNSAQTASATTSHFIEAGERLDIAVPLNAHIAVIRDTAATADGKLCITELV